MWRLLLNSVYWGMGVGRTWLVDDEGLSIDG